MRTWQFYFRNPASGAMETRTVSGDMDLATESINYLVVNGCWRRQSGNELAEICVYDKLVEGVKECRFC